MKKNNDFNNISTPDAWKQHVLSYQTRSKEELHEELNLKQNAAAKSEHTAANNPEDYAGKNSAEHSIRKHSARKHTPLRIAAASAAIIIASCSCVVGYDYFSKKDYFAISRSIRSIFAHTSEENIQSIYESVTDGNLKLTLNRVTSTKYLEHQQSICFEITAETVDGSAFNDEKDLEDAIYSYSSFANVAIDLDGEKDPSNCTGYATTRTDDESDPRKATFEVTYITDTTFAGEKLTLNLDSVKTTWYTSTESSITSKSLSTLLAGSELADFDTFTKYENKSTPGAAASSIYYVPPVGNLHIAISDQYPDCYIDNAGIGECEIYQKKYGCFYIAITTGSLDAYNTLRALNAYNVLTGALPSVVINESAAVKVEENRIILVLVPGRDDYWSLIEHVQDTNAIDLSWLSKYRLACLGKKSINGKTAHKGSWSFTINVDDMIYETGE